MKLVNDVDALVGYNSEFRFTHDRHGLTEVADDKEPGITHFINKSGDVAASKITRKDGSSIVAETGLYPDMDSEYRYNDMGQRHGKSLEGFSFVFGGREYDERRPVHYWNGKAVGELGYMFNKAQETMLGRVVMKAAHRLFKHNTEVMFKKETMTPSSSQHCTM